MNRLLALVPGLLLATAAFAQPESTSSVLGPTAQTQRYALVVGVSTYANLPADRQLAYASRDAELMYAFLRSAAGYNIPEDHIRLLRDEEARAPQIWYELELLRSRAQPGDEIILYFAGHGDVEDATGTRQGLLLAHDAPRHRDYLGNPGTIELSMLRSIVEQIARRGAYVMVITDACRAGRMNDVSFTEGAAFTSGVLANFSWQNLLRIASSGGDQLSYEADSLGQGVFTYYLIEGLLGAADGIESEIERDGEVTADEVELYVRGRVLEATDRKQRPSRSGNWQRPLARVVPDLTRHVLQDSIPGPLPRFEAKRLLGQDLLDQMAFDDKALTQQFFQSLQGGHYLGPDSTAALPTFLKLRDKRAIRDEDALRRMGDALATALEDSAQTILNNNFQADLLGTTNTDTPSDRDADTLAQTATLTMDLLRFAAEAYGQAARLRGLSYTRYLTLLDRQHFLEGYREHLLGNHATAVEKLSAIRQKSALSLTVLGLAHYRLERLDDAGEALQRAARLAPQWADPRRYLGFVAQKQERYEEALRHYQQAMDIEASAVLHVDLGEIYWLLGRKAEAERAWAAGLDWDPRAAANAIARFWADRDPQRAIRVYDEALARMPRSATLAAAQADRYRQQNDAVNALRRYQDAVTWDPDFADAHNGLGIIYEYQGRYAQAEAAYREALRLSPGNAVILRNLGDVYQATGRFAEAEEQYQTALTQRPGYSNAYNGLYLVYLFLGRYAEAEAMLQANVEANPKVAFEWQQLGRHYERYLRYDEAADAYRAGLEIEKSAALWADLGDVLYKAGQPEEAWATYQYALTYDSTFAQAQRGVQRYDEGQEMVQRSELGRIAFAPDGQTLLATRFDYANGVRWYDRATGHVRHMFHGHTDWVRAFAFAPDRQTLVTASDDQTVRLWDLRQQPYAFRELAGHNGWILDATFSPDGRLLATASGDTDAAIWDVATGQARHWLKAHTDWVRAVAFSPDGQTLATVADDQTLRLWDAATGQLQQTLGGHDDWLTAVAFSPDGALIATGSRKGTVRLWHAASGRSLAPLSAHEETLSALAFSPDGQTLATASYDQTVRMWNLDTLDMTWQLGGYGWPYHGLAFSPDGRTLATHDGDRIRFWDIATQQLQQTLPE